MGKLRTYPKRAEREKHRVREIASSNQLRMSYLRWALLTVPLTVLLGFASGALSWSDGSSAWYQALTKPAFQPAPIVFPIAWTTLYILIGLALAVVLNARGATGRRLAITLWLVQFGLNLAWSPVFFGAHRVGMGLIVIILMLGAAIATTLAFGRIRKAAAWLMLPYLLWLSFAAVLNLAIVRLNPTADGLVAKPGSTQIQLQ